jgi:hypothetical protein
MSLKLAIKKTIEYAANFGSHINKNEIKQRLISKNVFEDNKIDKEIAKLNWKNKKNKWWQRKIVMARNLAKLIETDFKEILFLGVSGSVATGHPKKNDDIDILIITKSDTLWKNRLKLRWWINKNKIPHRKYNSEELKNQFCFNLWLDENCLEIPKNRQNLKNALDLILLYPLLNKNNIYEKFVLTNNWAKKYVATGYTKKVSSIKYQVFSIEKENILKKISNWWYFWPQYIYMKPKIKQEKVNFHQAFFHKAMIK